MMRQGRYKLKQLQTIIGIIICLALFCVLLIAKAGSVPSLSIPQIPIFTASATHTQVLIAISNSESMDGNLSGAIMTGSGSLSSGLSSLSNSSSPVNYAVPTGFTPPLQGANASGNAPYTVSQNGTLYDNSASRLNVAKQGVLAILNAYMDSTDFGLEIYSTSGASVFNTWVYYMSPTGSNFTFTNTPASGNRYVTNPCYNYTTASSTVSSNCSSIASLYGATTLSSSLYMQIGSSSDDPSINDVLYSSGGLPGVFDTYNGPIPSTPYPPNYSISNYNNGSVTISYQTSSPNIGRFTTGPTNAGFVPFSQQVLYAQRGFGYFGSQSATTGNIIVPMTSAGSVPTTTSVTTALNLFTPYLNPESNNTASTEIKSIAVQSPIAGLLTKANSYLSNLGITSGSCTQKKYLILISDGLPTEDLNGKFWPPIGSAAATGYGISATFNADGSLKATNSQALTDTINAIKTLKSNGIPTYVIGLGAGVNPSVNALAASTLTAMAVAGGTNTYYPATDPATLVNDLNTILISIQNGSYNTSAAAVSSTHLIGGTVEFEANFVSADTPYNDWTGNIFAIPLDPTTGLPTATAVWSAQPLLDALVLGSGWLTSRSIATWNPTSLAGIPFQWTSLSSSQQALLQPSDTQGSNRVQYLRGNTALEVRNGGTFRNRSHILGDIIDSQVNYVGQPNASYASSSYRDFRATYSGRTPMIFSGANDGMLHAFNANTGTELFGFIPNAVFNNLITLTSPNYILSHLFFVNGSVQSADVQFSDSSWHTMIVGGEGAGGNSIYALDITDPSAFNNENNLAQKVLWEFTDSDLGLTYSTPQIGQIGSGTSSPLTFAVFFGNGYNSANNKSVMYAVDPQTGTLLKKIDLCAIVPAACNASQPQGLSSVAVGQLNGLQGQPITVVYAGDLQGNLWAVDVTSANPSSWSGRLLFQARDASGNPQPITTTPLVTLNPNYPAKQGLFVLFGTGQLLTLNDLLTPQTQTIYGVWDKPLSATTYLRANLQPQTLTLVSAASSGLSQSLLTATTNTVNWNSSVGWYADLAIAGQRLVTNPALINGLFIATLNTPPLGACGVGFSSMLLELNFASGGASNQAVIDLNGDAKFTTADKYNGAYPVGIGLSNSYANAPTVLGPNKSNNIVLLITQSIGAQTSIFNPNNNPKRVGWWQIQ
jgi:type IV pilus assembly protein PilY1